MKEFVLDFISQLEGYKTKIKELHWEDKSLPGHELAGDIEKMICDFEDSIAEDLQGVFGEDIKVNTLHPYNVKSTTLKEFIDSLKNSVMQFHKKLDGDDYIGARSEVEGFIHDINVKKYLVNKTTNELNENMKKQISESKLVDMITERMMHEFYLKEIQKEPVKLTKEELNEVINMAKKMVLNAKKK